MWFEEWSIRYLHDNAEILLYIVLTSSFVKKKNNEITEDSMWTSLVHCHCDVSEKHIVLPSTVYSCLYAPKSERLWLLPMMHQSWQSLLLFLMIVTPVPDAVRRWNLLISYTWFYINNPCKIFVFPVVLSRLGETQVQINFVLMLTLCKRSAEGRASTCRFASALSRAGQTAAATLNRAVHTSSVNKIVVNINVYSLWSE